MRRMMRMELSLLDSVLILLYAIGNSNPFTKEAFLMGMKHFPEITTLPNGIKCWQHEFDSFRVKVVVPQGAPLAEVINFGFNAPYLLVFEEQEMTMAEAATFAQARGFAGIAAEYSTSVVFVHPTCPGGWDAATEQLFIDLVAESRIGPYYQDGVFRSWNRFESKWDDLFIRGAIFRTHLYGWGKSADYIARCCLQTLDGLYLWGPGEITATTATLENLSLVPAPQRRDIPVVSVGNSAEINAALAAACDHLLVQQTEDIPAAFHNFLRGCKRWCGALSIEQTMDEQGMVEEPGYCVVPTSPDNCGDDAGTTEHRIGYIAYHSKGLLDQGAVPLVVAFHGGGDSALHMAHVSGWYRVAQRNGFLLVCVENHLNSTATEAVALVEKLKEKYPIDEKRIYASGFSMGGIKTWDLLQEHPQAFAALAPMSATVDVGHNVYFHASPVEPNRSVSVPVFYAGGEITPLPELPFQAEKCVDRMRYVLEVNQATKAYDVQYDHREYWDNPIWGVNGDRVEKIDDPSRGSVLTIHYFQSADGVERTAFASISGQGHECREHTCEQAWRFMSRFSR